MIFALEKIAEMPRQEYESAIPDVGSILAVVSAMAAARINREALKANKTTLARWHCPECGIHMSGFIAPDDRYPRRCQGIPKDNKKTDHDSRGYRICAAIMDQIYREDNASCNGKVKPVKP